ncbi:MAG: hypothetical protein DSY42_03075 [Aquifex sp.]|nr:MAG: hypothetical protein DSY42_03075 [Aquifex sp.]
MENGTAYVDELKTTITGRGRRVIKYGIAQLHFYLYLTKADYGRLYVYYKDKKKLELHETVTLDTSVIDSHLWAYLKIKEIKRKYSDNA